MNKLSKIIDAWGRQSLGAMLRAWWRAQFPEPIGPLHPWSDEIQEEIDDPEAISVCQHCLTPQERFGWFCPNCGAATGPYNNCMPFVNIFSQGEVFRAGVNDKIHFAKWVYPAYFLMASGALSIFAPLYWIRLFLVQKERSARKDSESHDE